MGFKNTDTDFGVYNKTIHWVIAILIMGMLIDGCWLATLPKDTAGAFVDMQWIIHKSVGVTILCLVILRVVFWLLGRRPTPYQAHPFFHMSAKITHFCLYALMIFMPLSGYMATSYGHYNFNYLGNEGLSVPLLPMTQNRDIAGTIIGVHGILAWVFVGFITLHVLGALFHWLVLKDKTLLRMIPFFRG